MKITGIITKEFRWPRRTPITNGKHTYTHVTFAVVEITTTEGITGIGLGGGGEIERATIARLTPMLIGEDPIDVERLWHKMWEPKLIGRRGLTTRAISAIDIGLWDIRAKFANLPLYKLLGGFRDRVPTYIAGGYYEEGKGLRELAREMDDNLRMGAKAVKMKVGAVPIAEDVARVRVAREAVGPDVKLMIDANCAYRHYAPHGSQDIHVHLVAAISNGLILEFYRDTVDPMWGRIYRDTLRLNDDGTVSPPNLPGIGVDPDYDALAEFRIA